jgi:hypothetical protein
MTRAAITTKFLGPTNYRGARIKVRTMEWSITVAWDYSMSTTENYAAAAAEMLRQRGWDWTLIPGILPDGNGVFVKANN